MDTRPPADDPLVAFLSGKRRSPRFDSTHPVLIRGGTGEFAGRTVDASADGVHLVVEDPAFYAGSGSGLDLVTRAFPDGLDVFFPETGTTHRAAVVRIVGREDGAVSLGCRFLEVLSPAEARILGVPAESIDEAEVFAAALPRRPRPGAPLSLLVFGRGDPVVGPLYVARVEAAGDSLLDVRVPGPDGAETRIANDLGHGAFYAALVRGRRRLWEGRARLVRVTVAGDEIVLRVLVDGELGHAFRRSLEAM